MSNAQHTPEFFLDQFGHVYAWRNTAEGKVSEVIVDGRYSKATFDEKRLIAAAPELLEALQASVKEAGPQAGLDDGPGTINTIARYARAAIAKATGEQS